MTTRWSQRVKDAQAEVERCSVALDEARSREYQLRCEEFPVKVGTIVETRKGTYKVTSVDPWSPTSGRLYCVKRLKGDTWGTGKHNVYYPEQARVVETSRGAE